MQRAVHVDFKFFQQCIVEFAKQIQQLAANLSSGQTAIRSRDTRNPFLVKHTFKRVTLNPLQALPSVPVPQTRHSSSPARDCKHNLGRNYRIQCRPGPLTFCAVLFSGCQDETRTRTRSRDDLPKCWNWKMTGELLCCSAIPDRFRLSDRYVPGVVWCFYSMCC